MIMAHDIETFEDGTAAFFTARVAAWHRLGTVTEGALTAQEALKTAYLDTEVQVTEDPITSTVLTDEGVHTVALDGKFLTYRQHPKTGAFEALGVVGNRYVPIQNADAFEFLNYVADESGAVFETAGSLNGGKRVFMSMKFPESMTFANGQDPVGLYLLAANSHDGTSSFTVAVTPVRVVCQNTLTAGLRAARSHIALKHTVGAKGKIAQARETLGLVFKYQEEFEKEMQALLDAPFTTNEFVQYVETLLPSKGEASQASQTKNQNAHAALMGLWNAPTQRNVFGTRYAAWNTAVEYADWVAPMKAKGRNVQEVRAERIMLGSRDAFKQRALSLLVK